MTNMQHNFQRANARRYPARDGASIGIIGGLSITIAMIGGIFAAMLVDDLISSVVALAIADPQAFIGGR